EAISTYKRALTFQPNDLKVLTNLTKSLLKLDWLVEAMQFSNQAFEARKDEDPNRLSGLADTFYNLGYRLYEKGQFAHASNVLSKALVIRPNDPDTLTTLGAAFYEQELFSQATHSFNRALELKADDSDLLYNLGLALLKQNQNVAAMQAFYQVLDARPNDPK